MASENVSKSIPTPAFDVLRAYLEARASFGPEDLDVVRSAFLYRRLRTGEFLQRAGDVTQHAAFVATGCLRNYVIDAKGKEHIVQFAPETWWLADSTSLSNRTPSTYFIDAIEDSELLLLDGPSHMGLLERVPNYAPHSGLACKSTPPPRISASSAHSAHRLRSGTWSSSACTRPSRRVSHRRCSPRISA
jgi:hypothetical protein